MLKHRGVINKQNVCFADEEQPASPLTVEQVQVAHRAEQLLCDVSIRIIT